MSIVAFISLLRLIDNTLRHSSLHYYDYGSICIYESKMQFSFLLTLFVYYPVASPKVIDHLFSYNS